MRRLSFLLAGSCVAAFAAAAVVPAPDPRPIAPEPIGGPEPITAPEPPTSGDPLPPHIARLHLPPPAQSRGPVEAIPRALAEEPLSPPDGIRRCSAANGTSVFTDRRCEDVDAVPAAAPGAGSGGARLFVRTCAQSREQLVDGLRDALEMQDANRVASYYHWTGMGTRAGYALMDRLQGFSERPLMDVRLVTSAERTDLPADVVPPLGWYPLSPAPGIESLPPPPPRPRAPDLVRVDQMRSYDSVSSEVTYLHLLPNAGCWWVRF